MAIRKNQSKKALRAARLCVEDGLSIEAAARRKSLGRDLVFVAKRLIDDAAAGDAAAAEKIAMVESGKALIGPRWSRRTSTVAVTADHQVRLRRLSAATNEPVYKLAERAIEMLLTLSERAAANSDVTP